MRLLDPEGLESEGVRGRLMTGEGVVEGIELELRRVDGQPVRVLANLAAFMGADGTLAEIEAGIAAAREADLRPLKFNCVVTRDYNDEDVVEMARRARDEGWHVRFIELMPLGGGDTARVALTQFVPSRETRARIDLPDGFEYEIAEVAQGSAKINGPIPLTLTASHAHFATLRLNNYGLVKSKSAA